MNKELQPALEAALDALWVEHGNGYGTAHERLISDLQAYVDHLQQETTNEKPEE